MDRYSLEKLLEEAQADEEANANELEMTDKETQDGGKQDSDANEKILTFKMQIALAVKLMEKPKRNLEVEKEVASAPVGDVG